MSELDKFLVTYIEAEDGKYNGLTHWYFECSAEDSTHAIEQCVNASPDCIVIEVEWIPEG